MAKKKSNAAKKAAPVEDTLKSIANCSPLCQSPLET